MSFSPQDDGMGNIFADAWSVVEDVAHAITHPTDTAEGAWNILSHPARSVSDFADAVVTVMHEVPGVDFMGEQLKDFARTSYGKVILTIVSTFTFYAAAPVVGTLWASAAFAIPGLAKRERFLKSYIQATMERTEDTLKWFAAHKLDAQIAFKYASAAPGAEQLKAALEDPDFQVFVATLQGSVSRAAGVLEAKLGEGLASRVKDDVPGALEDAAAFLLQEVYRGARPNFRAIAAEGGKDVREDMSAMAFDVWAGTRFFPDTKWDPETGRDAVQLAGERMQAAIFAAKNQTIQNTSMYSARGRANLEAAGRVSATNESIQRGLVNPFSAASAVASLPSSASPLFAKPLVQTEDEAAAEKTNTRLAYGVALLAALAIGARVYKRVTR